MDVKPSSEQQQLIEAFADLYDDLATPHAVQAAEPLGHLPTLWRRLLDTGVLEMAVPETHGGYGASLLDLALVAEQHGRHVAPAPLVEAQVAARLLVRLDATATPTDLMADILAGNRLVTIAVRPATDGVAGLVPAAAIADDAIVLAGDSLLLVSLDGRRTKVDNLGSMPLADVTIGDDAAVLATGQDAIDAFSYAIDEWRVLTAAALSGIASKSLEIGVAYVKERTAFGRKLGSFQGIAHRLADRACEVDGAELLAREAAWAFEADPARAPELAAMALGFATETARDTTYFALHFHGGYGFMLEYPIQLYFRRARAWGAVLESAARSYQRVAELRTTAEAGAA